MLINELMTSNEALSWLKQVEGTVFHNKYQAEDENAWVAVVRTPGINGQNGKIILAFGETLEIATSAAEREWQQVWERISRVH